MKPGDMLLPGGMKINVMAPNSTTSVSVVEKYNGGSADIAKMRAEAMAMAKAAREQQGK
jgi:hypothetical protein